MHNSKTIKSRLLTLFCCLLSANSFAQSAEANQTDIEFYDKVVDQFNDPVTEAQINLGVRYLTTAEDAKVKTVILGI